MVYGLSLVVRNKEDQQQQLERNFKMCFRARSTTSAQVVPAVESVGMSTRTDLEGNEAADSSEQLVTGAALGRIAMNPHATKAAGLQNLSPEERKARLVKFAASARPTAQGQEHIRWRRGAWRSSTRPTFSYGRGWWKSLDGSLPS